MYSIWEEQKKVCLLFSPPQAHHGSENRENNCPRCGEYANNYSLIPIMKGKVLIGTTRQMTYYLTANQTVSELQSHKQIWTWTSSFLQLVHASFWNDGHVYHRKKGWGHVTSPKGHSQGCNRFFLLNQITLQQVATQKPSILCSEALKQLTITAEILKTEIKPRMFEVWATMKLYTSPPICRKAGKNSKGVD